MPTVCHLLHSLNVGGAEVLAARLGRDFRQQYRVVFACLDELGSLGEELRGEGFVVEVLGRSGLDWRCILRLRAFLRREQVSLIHAHQYTPFFYAAASRVLSGGRPILFTEHGRHFPDYPRRKRLLFNRVLLRRQDRVVGVGEAVRQALLANEGLPPRRVEVVYNGLDLSAFAAGRPEREAVRREIGVGADDWVLLQVARLDYLKDHATAIRAFAQLTTRRPGARLVLVGEGPERPKIEAAIRTSGVEGRVRLLGLRKDVARLLQAADVFLLSSISEGIPLTLIEAMAAGLPVVATRVGGVGEVVEEGATGLLAPSGDAVGLAAHLLRLVADPRERERLGEQGRQRAKALFSREKMNARYLELYEEMLPA